jgi:predicted DNA-binding protein (MmcQ/YjbR family)
MAKSRSSPTEYAAVLRQLALALPQAEEGVSCNKAAFKAGGKAFLFVGSDNDATNAMLKLKSSLPEAKQLAAANPSTYKVGGHNWVTITRSHNQPRPPTALLQRWIQESFRLLVAKSLVATLDSQVRATRPPKIAREESFPLAAIVTATGEGGQMMRDRTWQCRLEDGSVLRIAIHALVKTMKIPTLQVGQVVHVARRPGLVSCSVSPADVAWVSPSKLARLAKKSTS